jgi:hypothetical protein
VILGVSTSTFTAIHVVISLAAIAAGFVVVLGMLGSRRPEGWTLVYLATTALTSISGFLFPFKGFTPPVIFGVISVALLALVVPALYVCHLRGQWRWIYVTGSIFLLYLNFFVLVVQSFQKLALLNPLAPTQTEPPFAIAQGITLLIFVAFGVFAVRSFHPEAHGR